MSDVRKKDCTQNFGGETCWYTDKDMGEIHLMEISCEGGMWLELVQYHVQ
jgi:hypothetical protein